MSYTALYRKYRPSDFSDVKGQDAVVTTLKNQIKSSRIGHAYLFSGTRGTGKTTAAKIFARAVNCDDPQDGSPCGKCPSCAAAASGSSMNIIEMDAASNNGVDDVRQIREEVSYPPVQGRYKVYIIDEAHMLSTQAFNALLKTLEEPPSYVIFILATTEPRRLPVTILSRCQKYEFRRISAQTIAERMSQLIEQEGARAREDAIRYIARAADGSMRDALSLLDQCLSFYAGEELSLENVLEVLGTVDMEVFDRLMRAVLADNAAAAVRVLDEAVMQGREIGQFVTDFVWYLRNILLIKSSPDMESMIDVSADDLVLLREAADMVKTDELMRYIRVFSELSMQLKYAEQKRVLTEIAVIKLCKPEMETRSDALIARISKLERKLEDGTFAAAAQMKSAAGGAIVADDKKDTEKPVIRPEAIPEDIRQAVKKKGEVINSKRFSPLVKKYLQKALFSAGEDGKLIIAFDDANGYEIVKDKSGEIEEEFSECIGRSLSLSIVLNETTQSGESIYPDIEKIINFELTIEDE